MEIMAVYPQQRFLPAGYFAYDASEDIVNYDPLKIRNNAGKLALLHEISHALLGHFHYRFDFELYAMEMDAWNMTRSLAIKHAVGVQESYINECMDSYDVWLTKRGTCPRCSQFNLQSKPNEFRCYRCLTRWKVSQDIQSSIRRVVIK
ncbi:hypothetical protein EXS66_02835 [Candidatus Saccharibacteria bacterium]|nr:hypothetical protein [Candidatus Saccharibacteria bacterium]